MKKIEENIISEKYLKIIETIITDKKYKNWMKKISKSDVDFANIDDVTAVISYDHGQRHALIVAQNTAKLLKQYGENSEMIFLGYVAGLLHDIGIVEGKKGHAQKSYTLAKEYLKTFDLNDIQKELILEAIKNHSAKFSFFSVIDGMISIADKLDFDKTRRVIGKNKIYATLDEILTSNVDIENGTLYIRYTATDKYDNTPFYIIPKSIDTPTEVAKKLNLKIRFEINGKKENFEDRKKYNGYIYE